MCWDTFDYSPGFLTKPAYEIVTWDFSLLFTPIVRKLVQARKYKVISLFILNVVRNGPTILLLKVNCKKYIHTRKYTDRCNDDLLINSIGCYPMLNSNKLRNMKEERFKVPFAIYTYTHAQVLFTYRRQRLDKNSKRSSIPIQYYSKRVLNYRLWRDRSYLNIFFSPIFLNLSRSSRKPSN